MKRFVIQLIAGILFFACVVTHVSAQSACVQGDTNGDGRVTLADFAVWRSVFLSQNVSPTPTSPSPTPTAVPPSVTPTPGVSAWGKIFGVATGAENQFARMQGWGVKALRIEFTWFKHEPNAPVGGVHTYAHSQDSLIKNANNYGFKILGIANYTPQWAADPTCFAQYNNMCGPKEQYAEDFGKYVGMLVERFDGDGINDAPGSPKIDAWEIWNEPNLADFWRPQPSPSIYVKYLGAAYTAAKQANPNIPIITGGLCCYMLQNNAPLNYLKAMYAAGAKGKFDALGMHPYTYPAMPSRNDKNNVWQQMSKGFPADGQPDSIRSIMEANGDGAKQIWQTEMGAPTGGDTNNDRISKCDNGDGVTTGDEDRCNTEAQQKQMLVEAYTTWKTYPWAGPFFWYTIGDADTGNLETEHNYGLIRSTGVVKPAGEAVPTITQ